MRAEDQERNSHRPTLFSILIFFPFKGTCPRFARPLRPAVEAAWCGSKCGEWGSRPGPALAVWFFPSLGSHVSHPYNKGFGLGVS